MARPVKALFWFRAMCLLCCFGSLVEAVSWGAIRFQRAPTQSPIAYSDSLQPVRFSAASPSVYADALRELEALESGPPCQRIAARLLKHNCHLLENRNEASVLTDTGTAARDFLDFFATILAICDLERGGFFIPPPCAKFQEPVLAELPVPSKPRLHVSSSEIKSCLEGLGKYDSAWATYISYKRDALSFCNAARADHQKDGSIHLFQRIIKVMGSMTDQVETELGARFEALNKMFKDTTANAQDIDPHLDKVKASLSQVNQTISYDVLGRIQRTATSLDNGLNSAKDLEGMLKRLLTTALEGGERIARSHESALQVVAKNISVDVGTVMKDLETALTAVTSLKQELVESQSRAAEIACSQERIEMDMKRLSDAAGALSLEHERHSASLQLAQQSALQISETLASASASAESFRNFLFDGFGLAKWWPCLIFPTVSLIAGSYGLPPSLTRNMVLVVLGGALGFVFFVAKQDSAGLMKGTVLFFNETGALWGNTSSHMSYD